MDLNAEIGRLLDENGMSGVVKFKANYNTFKCVMILQAGYAVNFNVNGSLRTVLGFEGKIYMRHQGKICVGPNTLNLVLSQV